MNYLNRFIKRRKNWLKSRSIPQRCLILLYHRIGKPDKESDPYSLTVSPENFSNHLRFLKNNYNVISLSELVKRIDSRELQDKCVVITFDDGYADNLYLVKPLLEEYHVPAAFFLTSGYSGDYFWWDKLSAYLKDSQNRKFSLCGSEFIYNSNNDDKQKFIDGIFNPFKSLNYQSKVDFLKEINSLYSFPNSDSLLKSLTKDEVKNFASSPYVEIGGHTVRHFPLSTLDKESQQNEILNNKTELENIIQKEVKYFAYPHGDYDDTTLQILKENNFKCGLTGEPGVAHNDSALFLLNRLSIRNHRKKSFNFLIKYWLNI